MEELLAYLHTQVHLAPYLIFCVLLLAGFCLPVSEDGMLFISGVLASRYAEYHQLLFVFTYLGIYASDLICYTLGRNLGPKLWKLKFFCRMVPPAKIEKVHSFYERYGIVTLIFGRFVPFGVRNALFFTAGLGKMHFGRFALADLLACTITTVIYFNLYYHYGNSVIEYVKAGNIYIFAAALLVVSTIIIKKSFQSRKAS